MRNLKTYLGLTFGAALLVVTLAMTGAGTAIAQGPFTNVLSTVVNGPANPVPVFSVNDASNPVPIVPVGRHPYQFTYDVTSTGSEECAHLPIPEGMMLTLENVGVTAITDGTAVPETWVRVLRRRPSGFSIFRYLDDLQFLGTGRWSGSYETQALGGATNDPDINYEISICVGPPDSPATFNDARGVATGYLTAGTIVDALSLVP